MTKSRREEKEIRDSVERGEWKTVSGARSRMARYRKYATETSRKDQRVNIRISSSDLLAIKKRAFEEGLPYQTLIASLLHKYAAGRLVDRGTPSSRASGQRGAR